MKILKGLLTKMISLNAKTLLEELLEFKEKVENTDQYTPQSTDCNERTEQCIKDLVYRLQRYQNS